MGQGECGGSSAHAWVYMERTWGHVHMHGAGEECRESHTHCVMGARALLTRDDKKVSHQ